jgi:hypothetical protein
MNHIGDFLRETETTVPTVRGPGEGKVVGVLRDQSTLKVLSEETGGTYDAAVQCAFSERLHTDDIVCVSGI